MGAPIMNPYLKDFWLTPSRFKVLYGGRDSSKSWDTAAHSIRLANTLRLKFLCTRMYQNRIEESVYTLLKKQIWRFGFAKDYRILNNKIIHEQTGSEFIFYGLARNIDEIKSVEGIDVLWIEEGHSLTEEMWDILEPTIRANNSEIWIIFNPNLITDFVYQKFILNTPENCIVRLINYTENPFLSDTSKETIRQRKEEDYEKYLHIYEGHVKQDDEEVIIKRSWLNSCVDAHLKLGIEPKGEKIIGYDAADDGQDKNAFVCKHGTLINKVHQWKAKEDELFKSSKIVRNEAKKSGSKVIYDSVGLGAGTGSNIKEMNHLEKERDSNAVQVQYESFNSGGAIVNQEQEYEDGVKNKDFFSNVKAQAWKMVADRARNTHNAVTKGAQFKEDEIISISSECDFIEQLLTELSTPRREYDGAGRFRVEQKATLAKRGIKSPNLADAFVMCFAPHEKPKYTETIQTQIINI